MRVSSRFHRRLRSLKALNYRSNDLLGTLVHAPDREQSGREMAAWPNLQKAGVLRYHAAMPKSAPSFEVPCPCCEALLKIDPATKSVISHIPKATPKTFADMEEAARAMREHDTRKESLFRQSVEAEKNKADLLEKKFQEAVKRAKETPDTGKPIRDFDLD